MARIIPEIKALLHRHPAIRMFIFDDDLFTLDPAYVIEFCKAYVDAGIATPFVVNAHVQRFTEPMARALSEAPCMIVGLAWRAAPRGSARRCSTGT